MPRATFVKFDCVRVDELGFTCLTVDYLGAVNNFTKVFRSS